MSAGLQEHDTDWRTSQTDQWIYIATERVTPLGWATKRKSLSEESLKWGLHNIAVCGCMISTHSDRMLIAVENAQVHQRGGSFCAWKCTSSIYLHLR
jgi:hypothetical protein